MAFRKLRKIPCTALLCPKVEPPCKCIDSSLDKCCKAIATLAGPTNKRPVLPDVKAIQSRLQKK